jgi:GNAT superfamily N-acetyltransferase
MSTSQQDHLLARYDRELRAQPAVPAGLGLDERDGVVALVGYFNFVCSWSLPDERLDEVVDAWAARFRERGETLMWPVYSHDLPQALPDALARVGFVAEETATLMVIETHDACSQIRVGDSLDVRRVRDAGGLRDYLDAGEAAFGETDTWQAEAFSGRLDDSNLGLYAVYVDRRPVASGRIEMDTRWTLAELFGGGVAPEHRGAGLYRALVATRARAAFERGVSHLATSARETSRPILERLGFFGLSTRTGWVLRP